MVSRDYEELFKSLNAHRIKYLVVGAHAVIFYTEPRFTKDLDVWIPPRLNDSQKVYPPTQKTPALAGDECAVLCSGEMCAPRLLRRTLASAKPSLRYGGAGDLAEARRAKAGFKGTPGLPGGLHQALKIFGVPLQKVRPDNFTDKKMIFQIGAAPVRIDILMDIDGVSAEEAWKRRIKTRFGKTPVFILNREDLIKAKKKARRPQDRIDIKKCLFSRICG